MIKVEKLANELLDRPARYSQYKELVPSDPIAEFAAARLFAMQQRPVEFDFSDSIGESHESIGAVVLQRSDFDFSTLTETTYQEQFQHFNRYNIGLIYYEVMVQVVAVCKRLGIEEFDMRVDLKQCVLIFDKTVIYITLGVTPGDVLKLSKSRTSK